MFATFAIAKRKPEKIKFFVLKWIRSESFITSPRGLRNKYENYRALTLDENDYLDSRCYTKP